MQEIWKSIVINGQLVEISNAGNLKLNGKDKNQYLNKYGYCMACINGKSILVHRIVGMAFIPNPENKKEINHKNAIKNDNRLDNLEWVTHKENCHHAANLGLMNDVYNGSNTRRPARPVKMYDLQGNFIQKFESISQAYSHFGIDSQVAGNHISKCCLGLRSKTLGHKWKYCNEPD